jgi:heat shock protein HtpX
MENARAIIQQNTFKTYLCMAVLTLILGLLGTGISYFLHWGLTGTGAFLILSGIINFVAFYFSDRLILRISGAKLLEKDQVPELFDIVNSLCQENNLPLPKLYLIDTDAMNAFATGRDQQHAAVAVTRGLLEKLTPDELKGVVAHELSHIKYGDMRLMAVVSVVAGFISILADMYWHGVSVGRVSEKDRSGFVAIIGIILSLFAPLTAMFIQLAISRRREFAADASAAEMTHNPSWLAEALRKISMDQRPLPSMSSTTAHLYISSPFPAQSWLDRIFSTHPPVEERIAALNSLSDH